jgi:hypothetical protein
MTSIVKSSSTVNGITTTVVTRHPKWCKYGVGCYNGECGYAHSEEERSYDTVYITDKTKTSACRFALKGCRRAGCTFAHSVEEFRVVDYRFKDLPVSADEKEEQWQKSAFLLCDVPDLEAVETKLVITVDDEEDEEINRDAEFAPMDAVSMLREEAKAEEAKAEEEINQDAELAAWDAKFLSILVDEEREA